jgi:hypothetical protein
MNELIQHYEVSAIFKLKVDCVMAASLSMACEALLA